MHYKQSWAANGRPHGNRNHPMFNRSMQRASVNIYKTDNSYEMLVFAPGRIKEHFSLALTGNELTVSYTPPQDFPKSDWILREYSRGGFERAFTLSESIDSTKITAKYTDGVLHVSLPLQSGRETVQQEIVIS